MTRLIIITMLRLEPQSLSRSSPRPLRKIVGTSTRLIRVLERPSFLRNNSYATCEKISIANKLENWIYSSVEKKSRIFFPRIKEIFFTSSFVNDLLVRWIVISFFLFSFYRFKGAYLRIVIPRNLII